MSKKKKVGLAQKVRQEQKAQKALNKSEGKGLADALEGFVDDDGDSEEGGLDGDLPQQ